jgi:hypothetical protein
MRTRRRGIAAHGEAVAGHGMARRGAQFGWVVAGLRGTGAHARARVLALQGRGVAVPCAGHRHPGPVARRGCGEAMAAAGKTAARRVPARKGGTAAGGEKGVLRPGYGGLIGDTGSRGKEKEWRR